MAVHTVYSRKNTVSYSAEPYHIPYHQRNTKSLDGMGAMAIIQHRTTIGVQHGAQPYNHLCSIRGNKYTMNCEPLCITAFWLDIAL
jgi:hypothetical protein